MPDVLLRYAVYYASSKGWRLLPPGAFDTYELAYAHAHKTWPRSDVPYCIHAGDEFPYKKPDPKEHTVAKDKKSKKSKKKKGTTLPMNPFENQNHTLRALWTFEYTGQQLAEAANKKVSFHKERYNSFKAAREKLFAELKEKGIELVEQDDPLLALYGDFDAQGAERFAGSALTGTMARAAHHGLPTIRIEPEAEKNLREFGQQMQQHAREVEQYANFSRAFELNPDARLPLTVEDIRYFGL